MEYDLYAMDESFLNYVRPKVALTATGVQKCTWSHDVSGTVQAIVDDPLQQEHAALATIDAQTATAEALLAQLSAQAGQPASKEADAVWAQMQPLLQGLGAQADHLASPGAASQWLRDTKLPGLAAFRALAQRDTRYAEFGDLKDSGGRQIGVLVGDAEWKASRREWEAEAAHAESLGDRATARDWWLHVSAWYGKLADREDASAVEIAKHRSVDDPEARQLRGFAASHEADALTALERANNLLPTDRPPEQQPARAAEQASELGRSAGRSLRRTMEDIAARVCRRQLLDALQ